VETFFSQFNRDMADGLIVVYADLSEFGADLFYDFGGFEVLICHF
jgi:hypothetical protein